MVSGPSTLEDKLDTVVEATEYEEGTSLLEDSMRKFKKNKMAVTGVITITFLFLVSIFAKFTAPYSYDEGKLEAQNFPPTWYKSFMDEGYKKDILTWAKTNSLALEEEEDDFEAESFTDSGALDLSFPATTERPKPTGMWEQSITHLGPEGLIAYFSQTGFSHVLGTDEIGQDIFSRLIYGMRLSLFLALTVTFVSVIIGVAYGAISGYLGGWVDQIMMRFVDFLFGVPFIFLIILLMVFFGRHVFLIFAGLGLVYWIVLARIVRGQILSLKEKEFVLAAISNGVSETKIIFKHLVPNVLGPTIVFSTLLVPQIMLLEAFLSFIGLGVSPPEVSLGIMISDGASVLANYSWPIIFPGLIFSIMIFCMNFIGDGLRDALDPKLR